MNCIYEDILMDMTENKELHALLRLIDDPDEEVFASVSERICSYGISVIPNLENLWENTLSPPVQQRIESLIHQLHFGKLEKDFYAWADSEVNDLLSGTILSIRLHYPDFQPADLINAIEKIRRNIWLELNNYLTPLEQANILTSIIYNYYNIAGKAVNHESIDDFFIHKVVEKRQGNGVSIGILYQVLCNLLDINACLVQIPRHLIVAFYHSNFASQNASSDIAKHIHFLVDATTGQWYSVQEIESYLKRMNMPAEDAFYLPMSNKQIIGILLEEMAKCYHRADEKIKYNSIMRLVNYLNYGK
ncbi:MAG: transglutaminase family protein [Chitinophagaceae bacterium]